MASEAAAMKMGRAEADMGFMVGIRLKRLALFAAGRKQKSLRRKASLNFLRGHESYLRSRFTFFIPR